jgi:hypothetical protein
VLWDGCQSEGLDGCLVAPVASALLLWHIYSAGCQAERGFRRLPCGGCGQLHFHSAHLCRPAAWRLLVPQEFFSVTTHLHQRVSLLFQTPCCQRLLLLLLLLPYCQAQAPGP